MGIYDARRRLRRRAFLETAGRAALASAAALPGCARVRGAPRAGRPNVVLILIDDMGYGDIEPFGSTINHTPNLNRMAREGMKLTSFYVGASVCTPTRASLMTGCYPKHVGLAKGSWHAVLFPGDKHGLHPDEVTVAEVLKAAGYATGCFGKWHLAGRRRQQYPPELMPTAQGFDSFFGTPLHNGFTRTVEAKSFRTQLMRGSEVLDDFLDQGEMDTLTRRYTEEAVRFIRDHAEGPFFLYLAHNMPHVPLGASEAFRGQWERGLYGDVIAELDWSLGQVIQTLQDLGIDRDTLVLFTSDNGPWIEKHLGDYGGSADPLRGSKMMTWDGGLRVPCIVRWPGHVPAGRTSGEIATTLDLLPTFARLAGARVPDDRTIDGMDLSDFLLGRSETSPRDRVYFYCYTHLQAVRVGRWKLVLPRPAHPKWCGWSARMVDAVEDTELYDLETDIGESQNVAAEHPDVVKRLMGVVEEARRDLGDYDRIGRGARFFDSGPRRPDVARWSQNPARWSQGPARWSQSPARR